MKYLSSPEVKRPETIKQLDYLGVPGIWSVKFLFAILNTHDGLTTSFEWWF